MPIFEDLLRACRSAITNYDDEDIDSELNVEEVDDTDEEEEDTDYDYSPAFGSSTDGYGNHWSDSEIKSKIHEAENKVSYFKSLIERKSADLSSPDHIKRESAASAIRRYQIDLAKWKGILSKWKDMQ